MPLVYPNNFIYIHVFVVLLCNHAIDFLIFIATFLEIRVVKVNIDCFLLPKPHLTNPHDLLNDFMRSS